MDPGVLTPRAVAELTGGRLVGDGSLPLTGFAPLDRAGPGDLSLLSSGRYLDAFHRSGAGCVLIADDLADVPGGPGVRVVVKDPARAMGRVLEQLHPDLPPAPGVDPTARLGAGVVLGQEVSIAADF